MSMEEKINCGSLEGLANLERKKEMEAMASEKSLLKRALFLNSRLLEAQPNDPSVWKERRSLVCETKANLMKTLVVCDDLDLYRIRGKEGVPFFWSSETNMIEPGVARSELELTRRILSKGTRNCQAWSYREWIIQQFDKGLWVLEAGYCHEILRDDSFNVPAWDQVCRAAREVGEYMGEEWRSQQAMVAKRVILCHPGNESPWIYLRLLYAQDKESLYTNDELQCIYVDVLAEEADNLTKVKCFSVNHRGCVHALNLIMDLMFAGYKMNQNTRLVNAVSVLFAYYRTTYEKADRIRQIGDGIFWMVCAVTFSLNASTIRYCHKYRGTSRFKDTHLFRKKSGSPFDMKAVDYTLCAPENDDNISQEDLHWQRKFEDSATNDVDALKECRPPFDMKAIGAGALKKLDELTDDIINKSGFYRNVWSSRQLLFQNLFEYWEDEKEVEFCREVLEKDTYNIYAWDQRIFVATRIVGDINLIKTEDMDFGDDVYNLVEELENCFIQRRNCEVDDVLKLIRAEPENPFPWCHIVSFYRAYFGSFTSNHKVRDAILGILEQARNALPDNASDGIMGDDLGVVNVRGLINALNMLLDYIVFHDYDEIEKEGSNDLREVIDLLCPDSSLSPSHRRYRSMEKISYILQRLDKTLPTYGLDWDNAADQMLTGLPL